MSADSALIFALEGALAPARFVANASGLAERDSDRIIYTTTGALLYDGNGAAAAVQFAVLDNRPELKAADFLVIG